MKFSITLAEQERCDGDMMSTSVLKNGRASSPTIFSKNFASGSILSIFKKLFDTVYFTLPKAYIFRLCKYYAKGVLFLFFPHEIKYNPEQE